jgi:hypothetical protein
MKTLFTTCFCAFLHVIHNLNAHKSYSKFSFEYLMNSQNWEYINDNIGKISIENQQTLVCSKEISSYTAGSSSAVFSRKNKTSFFLKNAMRFFKKDITLAFIEANIKPNKNLSSNLLFT